jgi:hypothetical protein
MACKVAQDEMAHDTAWVKYLSERMLTNMEERVCYCLFECVSKSFQLRPNNCALTIAPPNNFTLTIAGPRDCAQWRCQSAVSRQFEHLVRVCGGREFADGSEGHRGVFRQCVHQRLFGTVLRASCNWSAGGEKNAMQFGTVLLDT